MKRSKKYTAAAKLIKKNTNYKTLEAADLVGKLSTTKFAGAVELAIQLKLTEKQKKETIRGTYSLPNKFGKEVKVLLFADSGFSASNTNADIVGGEELIADIESGKLEFDAVVATPAMMPKIAKLGRTLGSKGLMPNPKNGTVTEDPKAAIEKLKSGQRNFKLTDAGRITVVVAKSDMKAEQIAENIKAFAQIISPEIAKFGNHSIKKITLCPTMGPALSLDTADFLN